MNEAADLLEQYYRFYKETPQIVRSPGRINLIGEHTDYNDGFVLPAAIDRAIYFAIAPNGGTTCYLNALNAARSVRLEVDRLELLPEEPWARYLYGVLHQLSQQGHQMGGFNLVFRGNIPLGAGLSSSAALTCGFASALNAAFSLGLTRKQIVLLGQRVEHEYAGVRTGVMDQFANMFGEPYHALQLDCRSLEHQLVPTDFGDYRLLLVDSMVKHSLAESAYNDRRATCERGVEILQKYYPNVNALRDATRDMLDEHGEELGKATYEKCYFVVEENLRVRLAGEMLRAGDMESFGMLLYASHEGLRDLYKVTCRETDFLVEQTQTNEHILGSRQMGGGFGGCTINLVRKDFVEPCGTFLVEHYQKHLGLHAEVYSVNVSGGTEVLE